MNETGTSEDRGPRKGVVIFLTILPVWLVLSTGIGLWLWNRGGEDQPEARKFRTPVSIEGLESDLRKIAEVAGPRHISSERGVVGLNRVSAMIQGTLGPENAGYALEIHPGPRNEVGSWPIVIARLPGEGRAVAVVAGYDAAAEEIGVERNATGVASLLAVAQALAGESLGRPVCFAFVPHAYEEEAPLEESSECLIRNLGETEVLMVVEATGMSGQLSALSPDGALLERFGDHALADEIGEAGSGDRLDFWSRLLAMGAPAVRVSTRSGGAGDDPDDRLPDAAVHAAATERLALLLQELASAP